MKFDEVLIELGEFGTYQKRLYFLICLPSINAGIFMVISVFLLGSPDHRCAIPGLDYDTYAIQNDHHQYQVDTFIPESTDNTLIYDPCHVFPSNVSFHGNTTSYTCDKWVYDKTVFESTFVSQKDLVCDASYLPSIAKVLFFAGVFVGALAFGNLSDIIGRKKTLMISFILEILSSTALSWADSFPVFVILRFLVGAANAGIFMTGFVIGMELVGPSKRLWAGIVVEYFFALGQVILAGVGYLLRDWKYIEMAVSFVNILYLSYYWLIPESPRWLLAQGRVQEAENILRKAAAVNKVTLPEKIFDLEQNEDPPKGNLLDLFSTKVMAVRTFVIFFNWMVVSMVYYGLSLNTGNLGGDFYVNFTISGLVEFPAYTLCILLLDRVGRKRLHTICMVSGGLACVSTVFTTLYASEDLQVITVILAMIGKLGAAAAFAIIYVYSAELYPTVVRNAGMGASSCCARIGGMLAPYIADLNKVIHGDFGHALPLVVFGGASVAAGLLTLLLPETLDRDLPETIGDAIHFAKYKKDSNKVDILVNPEAEKPTETKDQAKDQVTNGV